LNITVKLVHQLITQQFPRWAHLSIKPVEVDGHDNRTFQLGTELLLRLPSAQCYAEVVEKEQAWLPVLAQHLFLEIPEPIAMGKPTQDYHYNWSIYRWINGDSANVLSVYDLDFNNIALNLARFLQELHQINSIDGPVAGACNFYRGGSLAIYNEEVLSAIDKLKENIEVDKVTKIWQKAMSSAWNKQPVWVHGDLSAGNIIIRNKKLVAVIDFGGIAIGDPACDLVIAWTFLTKESRDIFKLQLNLDNDTWNRARGWAVWKAMITLVSIEDKNSAQAIQQFYIINEILNEHCLQL